MAIALEQFERSVMACLEMVYAGVGACRSGDHASCRAISEFDTLTGICSSVDKTESLVDFNY